MVVVASDYSHQGTYQIDLARGPQFADPGLEFEVSARTPSTD